MTGIQSTAQVAFWLLRWWWWYVAYNRVAKWCDVYKQFTEIYLKVVKREGPFVPLAVFEPSMGHCKTLKVNVLMMLYFAFGSA